MTAVAGKVLQWAVTAELLDPDAGAHVGRFEPTIELVGDFVAADVALEADPELAAAGVLLKTQSEP